MDPTLEGIRNALNNTGEAVYMRHAITPAPHKDGAYIIDGQFFDNDEVEADLEAVTSLIANAVASAIPTRHVTTITVIDPDTGGDVEVEIRKMATGGMVGIDGSYLDGDVGTVWSPYDRNAPLNIPDDEEPDGKPESLSYNAIAFFTVEILNENEGGEAPATLRSAIDSLDQGWLPSSSDGPQQNHLAELEKEVRLLAEKFGYHRTLASLLPPEIDDVDDIAEIDAICDDVAKEMEDE